MKISRFKFDAELIGRVLSAFSMKALAEEGVTDLTPTPTPAPVKDPEPAPAPPSVNFEQLISQARKEEKAKLYPQIDKLKGDLAAMTQSHNELLLENAQLKEELETLKSNNNDSEWKTKYDTLKKEYDDFKKSTVSEEELRAALEKEFEVKTYLAEQKLANKDKILPVFADTISGTTTEEVDASIQKAIELTNQAKEQLGISNNPAPKNDPAPQPGSIFNKPPIVNPSANGGSKEFDIEYIKNLDPRSDEYKQWRKKQGLR